MIVFKPSQCLSLISLQEVAVNKLGLLVTSTVKDLELEW